MDYWVFPFGIENKSCALGQIWLLRYFRYIAKVNCFAWEYIIATLIEVLYAEWDSYTGKKNPPALMFWYDENWSDFLNSLVLNGYKNGIGHMI